MLKDWRVAEIAADLGLAEPGAFKAWSGTTPARRRAARNGAAPALSNWRSR